MALGRPACSLPMGRIVLIQAHGTMPGELATHCSLGFVQIDAGKEREHHEDQANCVRFQWDFFSNERISIFLFGAMTDLSVTIEKSNASNCSKPNADAQILFRTL